MKTLFLDTASHAGLLACVDDRSVVAHEAIDHRIDDAELMVRLASLLERGHWSYSTVERIACVTGPGGFTSLRVAVALANALAHELKVPSCGIHLSDLYAARLPSPPAPLQNLERGDREAVGEVWWFHSTKKNALFARGFGAFAKLAPESQLFTLDQLPSLLKQGSMWMGELIPEHRTIVDAAGMKPAPLKDLVETLPSFLSSQTFAVQNLLPWYGRGW